MNLAAVSKLREASKKDVKAVYDMVDSSEKGLSQADAEERITKFGFNQVDYDQAPSWFKQLLKSFANPFIFILLAIVVISFAIDVWMAAPGEGDFKTVVVVSLMIVISALISFFSGIPKQPRGRTVERHGDNHRHCIEKRDRQGRDRHVATRAWRHYLFIRWRHDSGRLPSRAKH